ncbi:Irregular chiasm C-roughest protein [Schistosoma japonicum]|nr:Irregular chiasm C-roughest protein [Schistosoma japonicum]
MENKQLKNGMELKSMLKCNSLQSNSNLIESVTIKNHEYFPVQNMHESDAGGLTNEKDVTKCLNDSVFNCQPNQIDSSTNFLSENYLKYIPCTYPLYTTTNTTTDNCNIDTTNNRPLSPYTNKLSMKYNQPTQLVENEFNTTISNMSPLLNTSECLMDTLPNLKQPDITSLMQANSWLHNSIDVKHSITSPLTFSTYSNNSSSLGPIFLMTSDLNYSTDIHPNPMNSSTSTVLIPPVILHSTNEQTSNLEYSSYHSIENNINNNTSVVLNSYSLNQVPDISIIPLNVTHYQQ